MTGQRVCGRKLVVIGSGEVREKAEEHKGMIGWITVRRKAGGSSAAAIETIHDFSVSISVLFPTSEILCGDVIFLSPHTFICVPFLACFPTSAPKHVHTRVNNTTTSW